MSLPRSNSQSLSWSLSSHATDSTITLTNSTIEVLDDLELSARLGPTPLSKYLSNPETISRTSHALIEAISCLKGRKELLRACWLFGQVANSGDIASVLKGVEDFEGGLGALVDIVVERTRDREVCESAGRTVSKVLGWKGLEAYELTWLKSCVTKLVNILITEVSLSRSVWALDCLGSLLRRDEPRIAFCERSGLATLVEILKTSDDNREEVYKTVFVIWMLSFALSEEAMALVLRDALSSRLVMTLLTLLDDLRRQRLKIARVTLAALKNIAVGEGNDELRTRFRREMVTTGMKAVLERMNSVVGSLWSADVETARDANCLKEELTKEEEFMSTFDRYVAEVRSGSLQWSAMHRDKNFFFSNAEKFESSHRDILKKLAELINPKANTGKEVRVIACSDLEHIIDAGPVTRSICSKLPELKSHLLQLMTSADDPDVRKAALCCAQKLLIKRSH